MSDLPPSVRIGMSVACCQLDPASATTSEVRARFLSFLGQPPVMDLVRELTALSDGRCLAGATKSRVTTSRRSSSGRIRRRAPVAWARLLLPEEMTRRYGRDFRMCLFRALRRAAMS